jgi:hypothetical protein
MFLGIGTDHLLYTRASLRDSPWVQIPSSGSVLAATPLLDGSVVAVGLDKRLYTRASLTAAWVPVSNSPQVLDITVLPNGGFVAVGIDNKLYTAATLKSEWVEVPDSWSVTKVTIVPEDGSFIGIGPDKALWKRATLSSPWTAVPNSGPVIDVSVLPDGTWLGVTEANTLEVRAGQSGTWEVIPHTGMVIGATALPGPTLLAAGPDNLIYTRASLATEWNPVPESGKIVGITGLPDGRLLGIGMDHGLWTRATLTDSWSWVPGGGQVLQAVVLADGSFVGVALDNTLCTAATLGSGWVQVPNSGSVLSVAQMPDGTFLGVGTDKGLWTRATLDSGWVQIPKSGMVKSIAVNPVDGSVLGVAVDGSQWYRANPVNDVWKPVTGAPMLAPAWWNSPWGGASLSLHDINNAISRYGPVVRFHPNETYNMCSVEWFLARATLHDSVTGTNTPHPTPDQLPSGDAQPGRYWLIPDDSSKPGDLSTAKGYVHAYSAENLPYTDLQFWLFYGFNGPGTAHVNGLFMDTIAHSGDPTLSPLGAHYGDWECCVLRIDNDSKQLIGVYLTQHADGQYFNQSELGSFQRVGEQIVIYASQNGHARYPNASANYTEYHKEPSSGMPAGIEFELRNDTADGGQSLDCSRHYEVVAADVIPGFHNATWVDYGYRWGPEGAVSHMKPGTLVAILEAAFGPYINIWGFPLWVLGTLADQVAPAFIADDLNGPESPRKKSTWRGEY